MKTVEVNKSIIGKRCECIFTGLMVKGTIEEILVSDDSAEVKVRFDKPQHWGDQSFPSTWSFANKCDEYGSLQYLKLIASEAMEATNNSINSNGCSVCPEGEESFTTFYPAHRPSTCYYQYDYRHMGGELFSCVDTSLVRCRTRRDEWLKKQE